MPKHPSASRTTQGLRSSVFEALAEKIRRHEGPLFPLHVGDTWMEPHPAARAESQKTAEHPLLHTYAHPHGLPELLEALAERLSDRAGFSRNVREIQVTSGATSGLSIVCQTLLDPGDEVLVPAPFWPLIPGIIASRGARPIQFPFYLEAHEDGSAVEQILEKEVTDRTAAIYVNLPNNPTGLVLDEAARAAVARVAERHGLWILCDEAYEDLYFGAEAPKPFWAREDTRARAIAVHTFSKAYGLAGARVGYAHGPAEAMARVRAVFTHQAYCAAKPMQWCALQALRHAGEWLDTARKSYADAARRCAEVFERPAPQAGTFLFVPLDRWVPEGGEVLPFFETCMDAGVLLTPGVVSGGAFERWARVCFTSVPPKQLEEALTRLKGVLGLSAG